MLKQFIMMGFIATLALPCSAEEKGVMDNLGAAYDSAKKNVGDAATATKDFASDAVDKTVEVSKEAGNAVADGVSSAYQSTKTATQNAASSVADGASNMYSNAKDSTTNAINSAKKYQCGEKTNCAAMDSCAEAQFFFSQCGVVSLDENKNGQACDSLCVDAK